MRFYLGRGLQLAGLTLTGFAVVEAFMDLRMTEGRMFMLGFGGLAVFVVGTKILQG